MGWGHLVGVADRELQALRDGRSEEAQALAAEREALGPAMAPPTRDDRPALEMLISLQDQIVVECTLARDAVARELAALARGRGAVRGYRNAAERPSAQVAHEA